MVAKKLSDAMTSVDWNNNVKDFLVNNLLIERMDVSTLRIAIWSKQLENVDSGNPAITFVRALQTSAHHAVATMGLGIYKASASSIRGMVENALYYTYFRTHVVELASLVRDAAYYVSKGEILAFHKLHTPEFRELQEKLGLVSRMENWYSAISAIVHGQVPGVWVDEVGLSKTKTNVATLTLVVQEYCEAERIVHELLLLTVGREFWDEISPPSKKALLAGMAGEHKSALQLDRY